MSQGTAQFAVRRTAECATAAIRRVGLAGLATLLSGILCLLAAAAQGAALYRCTDTAGASVFTDNPVQLRDCQALEAEVAEPSEPAPVSFSTPLPSPADPPDATRNEPSGEIREDDSREIIVPVRRAGNLLIIATTVNGIRDADLILDTGASHTILSPEVANDLGLLGDPEAQLVTLKTAGGIVKAEMVRLDSIRIEEAEVENTYAAIHELPDSPPGIDGLLGLTFLRQFQVTLDTAKGLLHLRKPGN